MIEFLYAFLAMLPAMEEGMHWEMSDGGTIQQIIHTYNRSVKEPGKYVYHNYHGLNYLYDEDLNLDYTGFSYVKGNYVEGEKHILQPQLEALGFSDIRWSNGEIDSFGPLTRKARMWTSLGEPVIFVYG